MRIWHQSMTELDGLTVYRQSLESHAKKVLSPGQSIEVHGLPTGSYFGRTPTEVLGNAFGHHRVLDPVLDNAVNAEREGFDAFVVGSFSEPFMRELRSAVDIPVVSVTEAAFLVGCSIGKLIAPISNSPAVGWLTRLSVEAHGLQSRVMNALAIEPGFDEPALAAAYDKPEPVISAFKAVASQAISQGADVIVPAEGVLAELLYVNGVKEIEGATVLDVFGVTWAYAAMLAGLRSSIGLTVARKWHYRRDDRALIQLLVPPR